MNTIARLHAATLELTTSAALKQRLTVSFSKYLRDVDIADLPASLAEEFSAIIRGLEAVRPLPGESAVQATVRKMSPEQADLCAARILELYVKVAKSGAPAPRAAEQVAINGRRERGEARNLPPRLFAAEA